MKREGFLEVDLAATIVADEADQLFEQYPEAMETLLAPSPYAPVMEDRQIVLCGVNVPSWVIDCGTRRAPAGSARSFDGEPRSRALGRRAPPPRGPAPA